MEPKMDNFDIVVKLNCKFVELRMLHIDCSPHMEWMKDKHICDWQHHKWMKQDIEHMILFLHSRNCLEGKWYIEILYSKEGLKDKHKCY